MQCAAVFLLEVGYQSRHIKENNASITADIQKLINWLHVMQQNDPVAKRAHHVVRQILKNVAPILQDKASELLTAGVADSALGGQTSRRLATPDGSQSTDNDWAQGNLFDGSVSVTDHQYISQGADQSYYSIPQSSQDPSMYGNFTLEDLQLSGYFGNPFVNNWDEVTPLAGVQNLWYNIGTDPADQQEDIGDMNLYPGFKE
jgi:hypothetical protein